jgi:large subunit ribosomal protein L19
MNPQLTHEHFQIKKSVPELRAGDRVRVHQKIKEGSKERVQVFEGIIVKLQHGKGINGTFTVRRITLGVGVEKTFPLHLPTIVKIEKLRSAKVRQAKILYIRDLIGKKANRLKREKEDKEVWENVVEEKVEKDPEEAKIDEEIAEAEAEKVEENKNIEEKIEDKIEEKTETDSKDQGGAAKPEGKEGIEGKKEKK